MHRLLGTRKDEYSITLSSQSGMRMILKPNDNTIVVEMVEEKNIKSVEIREVVDYHGKNK